MDRGIINACINIWIKFTNYPLLKGLVGFFYAIYAFSFDQAHEAGLVALFLLIIIDFITALASAYKSGEEIKSRKIFVTAVKIVVYFTMIACGRFVEKAVPVISGFVDETILAFLALTELISVLENCGKMGFAIPQKLLQQLQKMRNEK